MNTNENTTQEARGADSSRGCIIKIEQFLSKSIIDVYNGGKRYGALFSECPKEFNHTFKGGAWNGVSVELKNDVLTILHTTEPSQVAYQSPRA